jgi:hypothetical protein
MEASDCRGVLSDTFCIIMMDPDLGRGMSRPALLAYSEPVGNLTALPRLIGYNLLEGKKALA